MASWIAELVIALVDPPGELRSFWADESTLFCTSIKLRINACCLLDMASNVALCAAVRKASTTTVSWEVTLAASGADAPTAAAAAFSFTWLGVATGAVPVTTAIARDVASLCVGCY